MEGCDELTVEVYRRIIYFWNNKLVLKSTDKKLSGLYLYSSGTSIGKSAFINCINKIVYSYKHCLMDNGWQENFDVDVTEDQPYQAYLIDGFNDIKNFDLSILETICDNDVSLKRRGSVPGKLRKGTPFISTSNLSPTDLLGGLGATIITARALIVNCEGVTLFDLLQSIPNLHNLPPFFHSVLNIPPDLI